MSEITPEERAKWKEWAKPSIDGQTCPEHVQILRFLNAIEAAEARAEKAEAQVARLTAERDWLADKLSALHPYCPLKYLKNTPLGWKCHEGSQGPCTKAQATGCWKEAARKAVAGEGEE